MALGYHLKKHTVLWPLTTVLVAGWFLVDRALHRPRMDYTQVSVPLRMIAEKRLLAADQQTESRRIFPSWLPWWGQAHEFEDSVIKLFRDAAANNMLDDALRVDMALVLHRAAARQRRPELLDEARALIQEASVRTRENLYFEPARKLVEDVPLESAEKEVIARHLATWPDGWWLNYLGAKAKVDAKESDASFLEKRRRALADLNFIAILEMTVTVAGIAAIVPFLRSLRAGRTPARKERRLWRLWGLAPTITLMVVGFALGISFMLGSQWFIASGFSAAHGSPWIQSALWLILSVVTLIVPVWFLRWSLAGAWGGVGQVFGVRFRSLFDSTVIWTGLSGALVALLALMSLYVVAWVVGFRPDESLGLNRTFAGFGSAALALEVFWGVLLAPFVEEIVFRGFLFNGLRNELGAPSAAVFSSAPFAIMHHYDALGSCGVFLYGMIFCFIYHRTNRLAASITAHSLNNLFLSALVWLEYR